MEAKSNIKYIRVSPKKIRFIVADLKKKTPQQALDLLLHAPSRTSKVLYKAIKSALDSARAAKLDENMLKFKVLAVDEGPFLKRSRAGGRGTPKMYRHRSSHIKVVLADK